MNMKPSLRRNLKYCTLQGVYWMLECITITYAGIFLLSCGYSNSELGLIMAAGYILGFVLQPLIAGFIDRAKKASLLSVLAFIGMICILLTVGLLLFPTKCLALTGCYLLRMALEVSMQPLINSFAFTLERLGTPIAFGAARGCGSLFYAVFSALLGMSLNDANVRILPVLSLSVFGLLFLVISVLSPEIRGAERNSVKKTKQEASILLLFSRHRSFVFLLVGLAGIFFGHSVIDNFPYQIVAHVGGSGTDVGVLHAFMAVLELPGLLLFDRLYMKMSCISILKFAALFFLLKNFATFFCTGLTGLYLTHLMHALSFALMLPASVRFADESMDAQSATLAQALVTGMMSIGNVLSSALGGAIIDKAGTASMLLICAVITAAGTACIVFCIRKKETAA